MIVENHGEDENERALIAEFKLQNALEYAAYWQTEADYWHTKYIEEHHCEMDLCACIGTHT